MVAVEASMDNEGSAEFAEKGRLQAFPFLFSHIIKGIMIEAGG